MLLPAPARLHPSTALTARIDLLLPATPRAPSPFPSSPRCRSVTKRLQLKLVFLAALSPEPCHGSGPSAPSSFSSALSSRIRDALLFLLVAAAVLGARSLLGLLPRDFSDRWRRLLASAEEAESECVEIPGHLVQAVVASEDRRFFRHVGVDPVGLARAVVYFPRGGGGSTITQQVYWGHGKYGIKSASMFYFGKQPSLLSVGESAMLAGMLPAPETLSPFKHRSRGKLPQARVLRKMVEAGFIDIKVALFVASQTLYFHDEPKNVPRYTKRQTRKSSVIDEICDWESASRVWEAREYLESWARRKHKQLNFPSQT